MKIKHIAIFFIVLLVLIGIYSVQKDAQNKRTEEVSLTAFKAHVETATKKAVITETSKGVVTLRDGDVNVITYVHPSDSPVSDYIEESGLQYRYIVEKESLFGGMGGFFLGLLLLFVLFSLFAGKNKGGGQTPKMKKEHKIIYETPTVRLQDVGGLNKETKAELSQIISLFKEHEKAMEIGVKKPKAALLHGPPGTGKTMIGKAIAHELNAVFFAKAASSFMELYVGVGSSRIREMFQMARSVATAEKPALIFIDEIDAIAKKRGGRNSHEERENTLNELLKELDGVETNENVFFIAATNLYESLDEAFKRSGRISNELYIGLPEEKGRVEILTIHADSYALSQEVVDSIPTLAQSIRGYSGADIEEMYTKAAKRAFSNGKTVIEEEDIQFAIDRMALGTESHKLTDVDVQKRVAYHEAGHALVQALRFPHTIRKATIIPRGGALGFVAPIPKEIDLATYDEIMDKLAMIVAGGVAERHMFGQHSVGVGGDVKQARQLIDAMLDIGLLEDGFTLMYEKQAIEQTKERLFREAINRSVEIVTRHESALHAIARALLEKETLDGEEIQVLVEKAPQ